MARSAPLLAAALAVVVATSCPASGQGDEAPDGALPSAPDSGGAGEVAEASSLFTASESDPGLIEFTTKDEAFLSDRGYTLWALKAASQSPYVSRTVSLSKTGGSADAGYGIVFCHHGGDERMLVVMIDAQGEYIVGEAEGSAFTVIVPWTDSPYLKRGFCQDNVVAVSLDAATSTFTLAINGADLRTFSAREPDYELGGGCGYIVVISPRESFPGSPVGVTFREL